MGQKNGDNSEQESIKDTVRRCAIIITGFAMVQSLRLTITGGAYAVKRFGLDPGETGVFIKMTLNTTEIFCVSGIIITTIYSIVRNNYPGQRKYDKYISIALSWLNFVVYVCIFLSYYSGGTKGHLTCYYWSLVAGSFAYGLHQSMVINMVTNEVAYYFVGLPMSGVQILLFHIAFRYIYKKFNKPNIEFDLVINQIVVALMLWLFASLLWTYAFFDYEPENNKEKEKEKEEDKSDSGCSKEEDEDLSYFQRIGKAISPFMLNILGMMFIFFFYPAIAPYELVKSDTGYKIDLCVLFFSTLAAIVLVLLVKYEVGPNRCWKGTFSFYHSTWILLIINYGIMIILLVCLHYPETWISKFTRGNPIFVGFITVLLKTCDDTIRGISTTGVSMQRKEKDGDMATLANCIAQIFLNIFSFIGLGYIRAYRMYDKDRENWPTEGLSVFQAFLFWVKKSCKGGWSAFLQSFTLDVRGYFEPKDPDDIISIA